MLEMGQVLVLELLWFSFVQRPGFKDTLEKDNFANLAINNN